MDRRMITTALIIDGYKITENLGIVRGITVRSRSLLGNIAGGLQTLFGGNISIYKELCEQSANRGLQRNGAARRPDGRERRYQHAL
jgi:uncharacterized protein YbjQ (UPF0145 family)